MQREGLGVTNWKLTPKSEGISKANLRFIYADEMGNRKDEVVPIKVGENQYIPTEHTVKIDQNT